MLSHNLNIYIFMHMFLYGINTRYVSVYHQYDRKRATPRTVVRHGAVSTSKYNIFVFDQQFKRIFLHEHWNIVNGINNTVIYTIPNRHGADSSAFPNIVLSTPTSHQHRRGSTTTTRTNGRVIIGKPFFSTIATKLRINVLCAISRWRSTIVRPSSVRRCTITGRNKYCATVSRKHHTYTNRLKLSI